MSTPVASPWRPARLGRLIRKELSEILRDRRTVVTLLLMPVLLYPLLGLAFYQVFTAGASALESPTYRIAFVDEEQAALMVRRSPRPEERGWLIRGEERLLSTGRLVDLTGDPKARLRPLPAHQELLATLAPAVTTDPEAVLRGGAVDVVLRRAGRVLLPQTDGRLASDWEVLYLEGSPQGREAYRYVARLIEAADREYLGGVLRQHGIRQRSEPTRLVPHPVEPERAGQSSYLSALIPLVLILMTITGAVYPAIDLTAGERERGTLEILAAAPIPRLSLLFAKYVAVLTVALLTAVVNLVPMIAVVALTGVAQQFSLGGVAGVAATLLLIFALLVLFAAFFSAVLLAITSFARSFKEAQAYLVPLMLVSLAPGVMSLLPGLEPTGGLAFVPLLNIVLLARNLLDGTATLASGAVVVGVTLLYAAVALAVAARIFGTEVSFFERRTRKQTADGEEVGPVVG